MPAYYVVVSGLDVVVRASGNGHVTGSIAIPVPAAGGRTFVGGRAYGGPDDQHFVIVVSRGGDLPGVSADTLFLLTVSRAGRPGRLSRLSFDNRGVPVTGAALSPDGTRLALSLTDGFPGEALYGDVVLINVRTGSTRTWTGRGAPGYWPGVPAWTDDGTIVVPWWHSDGPQAGDIPAEIAGVREVDLAAPGSSLLAGPLASFPAPVAGLASAMITPGGGELIGSSCRPGHHTATARVIELSASDGRLVRVLHTQTARFRNDADAEDAAFSTCQVLSVASGAHVLVQAFALGRLDNGVFTALPGTPPHALPVSAAW